MSPARKTKSYMSRTEFESILNSLFPDTGKVRDLAIMLHRDRRTVRRWRNGEMPVPPEAAMLMRGAVKYRLSPEEIGSLAHRGA